MSDPSVPLTEEPDDLKGKLTARRIVQYSPIQSAWLIGDLGLVAD